MDKQVQVNIRLAESSADRLKALAESSGLKLGAFVERLIAGYRPDSNALQNDSNAVQDWRAVTEELRELIANQDVRLCAIETAILSGFGGRDTMVRVTVSAADLEPVETIDDTLPHPADHSFPTAQEAKIQYERQLDERIIALRKEGKIIKAIQKELKIGQKRVCKAIKEAGLVE